MRRVAIFILSSLMMVSCASRLKKECEAKNWFQHGFDIAMTGHRASGDTYVVQCQKEGAEINHGQLDLGFKAGMKKYCNPKTSYDMGRKGLRLGSGDLCTPGLTRKMEMAYGEGLAVFCTSKNGKVVGESGRKYDHVCPAHLEPSFLKTYKMGRKKYLEGYLRVTEKKIRNSQRELSRKESDLRYAERALWRFKPNYEYKREKVKDADGKEVWKTTKNETFESQVEKNRLNSRVERKRSEVKSIEAKITELQKAANDTQLELSTQF